MIARQGNNNLIMKKVLRNSKKGQNKMVETVTISIEEFNQLAQAQKTMETIKFIVKTSAHKVERLSQKLPAAVGNVEDLEKIMDDFVMMLCRETMMIEKEVKEYEKRI